MNQKSVATVFCRGIYLLLLMGTVSCGVSSGGNGSKEVFSRLEVILANEKENILNHFSGLAEAAADISQDEVMLKFFQLAQAANENGLSQIETQTLDTHFVYNYGSFYDVLFVSHEGFVFHSIKQEDDHQTNLFSGPLSSTALAEKLKADPQTAFVDFQPYGPSGEPAAFFISRVNLEQKDVGWFILQYGSNEMNAMLSGHSKFGRTGEVYLVNGNHLMLSDSRFVNESSILKVFVDTEPVRTALDTGCGNSISTDYRGIDVYSSFDTVDFMGVQWVLLAEVDADEILNEFYLENSSELMQEIASEAASFSMAQSQNGGLEQPLRPAARVDINELKRVSAGELCWTPGVGPCTALIAYYPQKFGYLLHFGPTDDTYSDDALTKIFLGSRRTNLVKNLMERITRFDVVESDLGSLRFVIVATHTNSLKGTLDILLKKGIALSQICFVHNPEANYSNASFNQSNDQILVEWVDLIPELHTRLLVSDKVPNIATFLNTVEK